jgi:MYXO-CTERM domain-containing protein
VDDPGGDCDDEDPEVYPLAIDLPGDGVDTDCDGTEVCYIDGDGDGVPEEGAALTLSIDADCEDFGEAILTDEYDCDDTDASIYPGAPEIVVDGIDQDCDGGDACYADADGDGYRDMTGATILSEDDDCDDPGEATMSMPATDCDDSDASVYPGTFETVADGVDQDCDGTERCYTDIDGDGHADDSGATTVSTALDCSDEGAAGLGSPVDDCDDSDGTVHPGASEGIADGRDSDCDGTELCYMDADGDGARSSDGATVSSDDIECDSTGEAGSSASVDCDDTDGSVYPSAIETPADGIDSNCDGAELCYTDYDGDGFRPDEYTEVPGDLLCTGEGMVGASAPGGDCDDSDASINPDGDELPADGIDSDCDGLEQCYVDADGDGYRTTDGLLTSSESLDCDGDGVSNADAPDTDCDDERADVNPGQRDAVGDEVDGDCDGFEDCYVDADGDGYRTLELVESIDEDCQDEGEASLDVPLIDCDDSRPGVYPGADEIVGDGVDSDCDGLDPASPEDTGEVADDDDESDDESDDEADDDAADEVADKGGCGCATTSSAPAALLWWTGLLGLVVRRRRQDAA